MSHRAISRIHSSLLLTLFLLSMFAGVARADVLFIGSGAFTPCAVGDMSCHTDPEYIGSNDLSIYVNSSSAKLNLDMPVLLILGLPNLPGLPAPSAPLLSGATLYTNYVENTSNPAQSTYSSSKTIAPPVTLNGNGAPGGGDYYGGGWNPSTGAAYQMLTSSTGDVYTILNLNGADSSNNWTNWSGADKTLGVNPTSFSLFVYEMKTPLSAGNLLDVQLQGSGLPLGAFAIAYGCNESNTSLACPNGALSQGTPFTRAGMTTTGANVPEPGSYVLLSLGLAAIGFARRLIAA